jgi:heme-degrading monooxygenase HmoA
MGEVYVCGIWTVRTGEEDEFVQRWQDAASWAIRNVDGVGPGRLFRDKAQPNRFLSFGPFDSMDTVEAWRERPEVQDRQAKLADVIENLERGIFEACVEVR